MLSRERSPMPRRVFLTGLASLPLIGGGLTLIGQPTAAAAAALPMLPAAARVCALAVLSQKACELECDAVNRYEVAAPKRPKNDPAEVRAAFNSVMDASPNPVTLTDNDRMQADMRRAAAAARL